MGSDESFFDVSLIVRGKVTRRCPQITIFSEKGEPKPGMELRSSAYQPCLTARPNQPPLPLKLALAYLGGGGGGGSNAQGSKIHSQGRTFVCRCVCEPACATYSIVRLDFLAHLTVLHHPRHPTKKKKKKKKKKEEEEEEEEEEECWAFGMNVWL